MNAVALAAASILLFGTLFGTEAGGQDIEPRAYANAPTGVNFAIGGYAYTEGAVLADPSIPLENAQIDIHTTLFAFARSFAAWGRSAKFDLVLPYSDLSGSADFEGRRLQRDVSGFSDPRFRVSMNLYGAPALPLAEFGGYRQDLIIGASLLVWAPLGQYDEARVINLGAHRWAVKPEIGVSKAAGRWTFELIGALTWYGDNDAFLISRTREQDPIYSVQGGVIYSMRNGAWLALSGTYYKGGRTTVDGVRNRNLQENSRLGVTFSLPVNRRNSVKLSASTGVSTRTGNDFDVIAAAWQYRWGGGL